MLLRGSLLAAVDDKSGYRTRVRLARLPELDRSICDFLDCFRLARNPSATPERHRLLDFPCHEGR
jgi:hypothetical protein